MKAKGFNRPFKITLTLALALALGACSSSKPKEGEMTDIIPASTEAGTDIVPTGSAEDGGASASDGTAPSEATMPTEVSNPTPISEPSAEAPKPKKKRRSKTAQVSTPVDPGPTAPGEYTVQSGDTLMKIAFETYGDLYRWKAIYEANKEKISNPNQIPKGTVLKVEKPVQAVNIERNGEKYQIQTGDTLGKISQTVYGTPTKWKSLWENNKQLIQDPNKIFAGFYLYYVPQAGAPAPMASSVSPSSATPPDAQGPAPASVSVQPDAPAVTPTVSGN